MAMKITRKEMKDLVSTIVEGKSGISTFEKNPGEVWFDYEKGLIEVDEVFTQSLREGIAECVNEDLAQGECCSAEMWRNIYLMSELLYMIYDRIEWFDAGCPDREDLKV